MKSVAGLILSCVLLACSCASARAAETYPSRTVKLWVPQAPGGATDVFARKLAQLLSERWNQPVIVENRAGAAGVIGTEAVAKSAPDGYTLLVTYSGSQAVNPSLYPDLAFDSVKDFQTVATIASTPFFFIANTDLPVKTLQDFVSLARQKPDDLTFASSGNGSINHLLGEMLKLEAGLKMRHVPYRGVAAAIADVVAGHVDTAFSSVPSVLGLIKAGQVRALAVSSATRVSVAPDVPTIAESG
jgi:tripartite-type tricarboxylate transporter receptor subunit TctC